MSRIALIVMSTALLGATCAAADDATKAEQKRLEGSWIVESATLNGHAVAGMKGAEFVFNDGR